MPIAFECDSCGRALNVRDALAGEKIYCPDCKAVLQVPLHSMAHDMEDEAPFVKPANDSQRDPYAERSEQNPLDDQIDNDRDHDHDDDQEEEGERALIVRAPAAPEASGNQGSILGGIGLMVLAVVWFFGALIFADRIFLYPPILFIIGLVTLIRGLLRSGNDA